MPGCSRFLGRLEHTHRRIAQQEDSVGFKLTTSQHLRVSRCRLYHWAISYSLLKCKDGQAVEFLFLSREYPWQEIPGTAFTASTQIGSILPTLIGSCARCVAVRPGLSLLPSGRHPFVKTSVGQQALLCGILCCYDWPDRHYEMFCILLSYRWEHWFDKRLC